MSLLNQLLADRYRIDRLLARGGMADVYLATDERLERQVAVKVIYPHLAADPRFTEKFIREAKMAARLNHPNLVNVFDQGTANGQTFMVMEYVPGMTLRDALEKFGKLTPMRALDLLDAVLQGLAAAHRAGILHRDLKPENVFLADDGRIKLGDFGLARDVNSNTSTGSLLGTIAYIAPELLTRGQADARSDVYSAGIMLFEFLTARQPFAGDDVAHIAHQHTTVGVAAPSSVEPTIPPLLDELVLWSTAMAPQHRPANAQVLSEVVQRVKAELKAGNGATARLDLPQFAEYSATRVIPVNATVRIDAPTIDENGTTVIGDVYPGDPEPSGATQVIGGNATTLLDRAVAEGQLSPLEELSLRRRKRGKWIALAIALTTFASSGAGWWFSAGPGGMTALPDLTSTSLASAKAVLAPYSSNLKVVSEFSSTVSDGLVTHTDPASGSLFWRGSSITLFVSKGAELASVPSLTGLTPAAAAAKLTAAHFAAGTSSQYFSTAPQGTVFDYLGSDGSKIAVGSKIALKVSAGPLPAVVGQAQADATNALKAAAVNVSQVAFDYSDAVSTGQVIQVNPSQDPLPTGGSVTLIVSKGPTTVVMPRVKNETIAASKLLLETLGLVVVVDTNQLQSNWGIVRVHSSSIDPGTVVKRGTQVIITSK